MYTSFTKCVLRCVHWCKNTPVQRTHPSMCKCPTHLFQSVWNTQCQKFKYIYTYTHMNTHTYVHEHTCAYMTLSTRWKTDTETHNLSQICIRIHIHTCINAYKYMYIHTCTYIYIYMSTRIHTYTYIHITTVRYADHITLSGLVQNQSTQFTFHPNCQFDGDPETRSFFCHFGGFLWYCLTRQWVISALTYFFPSEVVQD